MPTVEQLREKLVAKLKEFFQLDEPDLDFGFYRIMHAKAQEVQNFLEKDLLAMVHKEFQDADDNRIQSLYDAWQKTLEDARAYGVENPEQSIPVLQAEARLDAAKDTASAEGEVYEHLRRFFERYYEDGDFISLRYYSRENSNRAAPYAIPYNGEEVKLHWANADQYYIKTTDNFSDFSVLIGQSEDNDILPVARYQNFSLFDAVPTAKEDKLRLHFKVRTATEGEHGNIKEDRDKERFFKVYADEPVAFTEDGELVIYFSFAPDPMKQKTPGKWQTTLNEQSERIALAALYKVASTKRASSTRTDIAARYLARLQAPSDPKANPGRTILARYITRYTARNTKDYFIHKDLGAFLRRELDFYLKNEVMRLDDIESADAPAVESYLKKLRVMRRIAGKLIAFLAQLEDFQKKLWLKKKFVVECNYCMTLDRVPEEMYPAIISNGEQWEEWCRLYAFDTPQRSEAFLHKHPYIMLDTRFFDASFTERLLAHIDRLDDACDGILIHSENFQALRLMQERYRETVQCIYIDPPYNTTSSAILYKNSYKHSSWATLMYDRLALLHAMLPASGAIFVSIDKAERSILEGCLDAIFGSENKIGELIWSMNTTNSQVPNYSTNHEYVEVYAKNKTAIESDKDMFCEAKPGYSDVMELVHALNPDYPPITTIEKAIRDLYTRHKIEYREEVEARGLEWEDEKRNDPWKGLFNYNHAEYRDISGNLIAEPEAKENNAKIWVWREDNVAMPATKQSPTTRQPEHPNWRFYCPLHPVTGKPTPHPKSGWKFAYADIEGEPDRRSFMSLDADSRISWGDDEQKIPQIKRMLHEVETNIGKSVFTDYSDGEKQTSAAFGRSGLFLAPKHSGFVARFLQHGAKQDSTIVDCFGGTGSTAHAVINLNKEDAGSRKYVLAEMGNHFNEVLKPRLQKFIYSSNWKSGEPQDTDGISHCFKYLRLESYEDTLNNLTLARTPEQDRALSASDKLREDYMLRYFLDVESKGSQSLLNIEAFRDPRAYRLLVKKAASNEYAQANVDIIETFNWLIGLRVDHIDVPQLLTAEFMREPDPEVPEHQETRLVLKNGLKQVKGDDDSAWWFRKIEGRIPEDRFTPNNGAEERALIVWRTLSGDLEKDNAVLEAWFEKNRISTKEQEFDVIYVNGSNTLPNLRRNDEHWKVVLIEEEFLKRMWDVE